MGAFAVAPDYYFRKGDLTKITEMPALFPIVNAKTDDELFGDLDATVAWAKSQGGNTDGSALWDIAAADVRCGAIPPTIPT